MSSPTQNRWFGIGRLTKDASEVRVTPKGKRVVTLSLAINETYKDELGGAREKTIFINDLEVWGNAADACNKYLGSGSLVAIEARVAMEQWEDKGSGQNRSRLKLVAEPGGVQFLVTKAPGGGTRPALAPALNTDSAKQESAPQQPAGKKPTTPAKPKAKRSDS